MISRLTLEHANWQNRRPPLVATGRRWEHRRRGRIEWRGLDLDAAFRLETDLLGVLDRWMLSRFAKIVPRGMSLAIKNLTSTMVGLSIQVSGR